MKSLLARGLRRLIILASRILFYTLFRVSITGLEHYPARPHAPMIMVANHFSWFDAPLLIGLLPHPPVFLTARENLNHPLMRAVINLFGGIPVRRGHVDRRALAEVLRAIQAGELVAIFPEGGVQPEFAARAALGEPIDHYLGYLTRPSGRLIPPRAGTAYVAVQSRAQILPIAIDGSHTILADLRAWRRPTITIAIGPVFGPFTPEPCLKGRAKRARLNEITHIIMMKLAALLPPDLRGPYA
jgi:1-acyl-sn-glycerol-3-phosphate acyltransferase